MQTTKNTNYRIASWWGEGELPKANYQMQTIELLSGGVKLPNANYQIPSANYQNYQLIPGAELPKTIEHMSEMKLVYIFHKSCINCKNWSCTSSC